MIDQKAKTMNVITKMHQKSVHGKRVNSLLRCIQPLLEDSQDVLDVGCGDGLLASLLGEQLPETKFEGIDVLVRPETKIPIQHFDGVRIPFEDNSFDTVMMVDVLHHTEEPEVLLREAKRVARKWFVIKDHTCNGVAAYPTLRLMDWVGNAGHGVALPYNYLTKAEWDRLFSEIGMSVDTWNGHPNLYGAPGDWIFGRSLHFVGRLSVD